MVEIVIVYGIKNGIKSLRDTEALLHPDAPDMERAAVQ